MADITRPMTADAARDLGGRDWTPSGAGRVARVYLNSDVWAPLIGLEVDRYKSGNIRWATLAGDSISNAEASRILGAKVYVLRGQLHVQDWTGRKLTADELADAIIAEAVRRATEEG